MQNYLKKVAIYDLDGTILKTSLLMEHYIYLVENKYVSNCTYLEQWLKDKKNDTLIYNTANEYKEKLETLSYDIIRETAKKTIKSLPFHRFNMFVLERIFVNKSNNVYNVVISGSPAFLVKELTRRLGIKGYGSIYEELDNKFTGEIQPLWTSFTKKALMTKTGLSQMYIDQAYGDTKGDLSILASAKNKYLINPSKENEEYILSELPDTNVIYDK